MGRSKAQLQMVFTPQFLVLIVLAIALILVVLTEKRVEMHVPVFQDNIGTITIEPKEVRYVSKLTKPSESFGNYRLYISVKHIETSEIILVDAKDSIGEGDFVFTLPKLNENIKATWEIKTELKKYEFGQLKLSKQKCIQVEWTFGRPTNKGEITCKW